MFHFCRRLAAALLLLTFSLASLGQPMTDADRKKIFEEAVRNAAFGPKDVALAGQATLKLPANFAFVPQPQAQEVLHAMGNPGKDPNLHGIIFSADFKSDWFMTVRFESSGYVRDDDAKDWNADDLLKGYREGTEASNAQRIKMGVPELEILGWAEKPVYDKSTHRLVWAMSSREKGSAASSEQGVNYNTYALGREGYFMLNLVTGLKELPAHKPISQTMLASLDYNDGKKYADFNSKTDKVAEYGLAALVVGAAAKKLGFFAILAAFFAKFAKVILLAGAGAIGLLMKFFGKKKQEAADAKAFREAQAAEDAEEAALEKCKAGNAPPSTPMQPPSA